MSKLESLIEEFDGAAISILSEARAACRGDASYFDTLIALSLDPRPNISSGATWILKAEADDGMRFGTETLTPLIDGLAGLSSWQACLHIAQSVEAFDITVERASKLLEWASTFTGHERPFLRAWSLHVLVIIGLEFAEFREPSEAALASAENDSAASVRARARNLKKRLNQKC